ncbi:MAG: UDP-2,3-diacylglucosamine diphosphatase [Rubrivivax sp.]
MGWTAPPHWRAIDFISDLHLHAGLLHTTAAWTHFLQHSRADAICMLGDVFEAWIGDDSRHLPFERALVDAIRAGAQTHAIAFMPGNRDFLAGAALCADAGMRLLEDPTCLHAWGRRWLLAHGDAQCLDDVRYQAFRAQVRAPQWQQAFLAKPLAERSAIAQAMRTESRRQQGLHEGMAADLDAEACRALLRAGGATTLLHGHTHRPGGHDLGGGLRREVLSDWDLDDGAAPRAEVLRLHADGRLQRLSPEQACSGSN